MIDIQGLNVGSQGVFSFKPPYDKYVKDLFNSATSDLRCEILSIISMKDYIFNTHRDPFTDIYNKAAIPETEYKQDLKDNVSIMTFQYIDMEGIDHMFRVPATYIASISDPSNVEYLSRVLQVSLPPLPIDMKLSYIFKDLEDMISGRLGVSCSTVEVSLDDVVSIDQTEHETREKIRVNSIKINKSTEVKLREAEIELREIKEALQKNGIILGK